MRTRDANGDANGDANARLMQELAAQRPRSERLWEEALDVIPSGTVSRARILQPFPFMVARAEGAHLYDVDDNEYLDCGLGFGPHLLGHNHPAIMEAVVRALSDGITYGCPHPREAEFARGLVESIPCADKVTFCNSGSEATLNAIRVARATTGKSGVAKFEGGYHGWHDAVLGSVSFDPATAGPVADPNFVGHSIGVPAENLQHSHTLPFNSDAAIDKIRRLGDDLAVVLVDGVQGAGGAIPADVDFLRGLRAVCDEVGTMLLIDEAITGLRLARGGAEEFFGVNADLTIQSKVAGAGLPLGIIAGTDAAMDVLVTRGDAQRDAQELAYFGGTFNGSVPVMAAGIALLEFLDHHPDVFATINTNGQLVRDGIAEVISEKDYPIRVVGAGSMFHTRFVSHEIRSVRDLVDENHDAFAALPNYLIRHGLFIKKVFGVLSYAHSEDDIARIVEAYWRALGDMEGDGYFG